MYFITFSGKRYYNHYRNTLLHYLPKKYYIIWQQVYYFIKRFYYITRQLLHYQAVITLSDVLLHYQL